ncbi:hypothetical protein LSAT2_013796 [Lamellibrachia satsuma]|nr:hypothetical protein LSAT2_013796 [Lamellibrachia satsuma]
MDTSRWPVSFDAIVIEATASKIILKLGVNIAAGSNMDILSALTLETALQVMDKVSLVLTLCVLSSGILPCFAMYKQWDTQNVPIRMFVITAASCAGMFHYGMLIANTTIFLTNGIGALLQCAYILLYMLITPDLSTVMPLLAVVGLYESSLYYYIFAIATDEASMAAALGSTSSLLNMTNMVLLALELRNNFCKRNADGTPPVMVISGVACGLSWLIYGMMLHDPFVYVSTH